jgi:hypothetical protein
VKSIHAKYPTREKGKGEGARFEGLRRGDGAAGSLCYWRGNCAVDASLGGVARIVGQLVGGKCDRQIGVSWAAIVEGKSAIQP